MDEFIIKNCNNLGNLSGTSVGGAVYWLNNCGNKDLLFRFNNYGGLTSQYVIGGLIGQTEDDCGDAIYEFNNYGTFNGYNDYTKIGEIIGRNKENW